MGGRGRAKAQLSIHCRSSGRSFRLAFTRRSVRTGTGVADVVEAPGCTVWGVLHEIGERDIMVLDHKEGQGWAYMRDHVTVRLKSGSEQQAVAYIVRAKEPAMVPPSRAYLGGLVTAARDRGLPASYIRYLTAMEAADRGE
jgi:cation transport regulator ChaC